jgi:hypothetical protein
VKKTRRVLIEDSVCSNNVAANNTVSSLDAFFEILNSSSLLVYKYGFGCPVAADEEGLVLP